MIYRVIVRYRDGTILTQSGLLSQDDAIAEALAMRKRARFCDQYATQHKGVKLRLYEVIR